jgi:hypothetical protein
MSALLASLGSALAGLWQALNLQALLSVGSAGITAYFWLVKMNRERAGLRLYRLGDFRPDRPQGADVPGMETAVWYGGLCLANPSSLPAAVVCLRVQLGWQGRRLDGRLVQERKDDLPWTVEPLRVLSRSFGCAFVVPEGTARELLSRPQQFRFTFVTADGRRRTQTMSTCEAAAGAAALRPQAPPARSAAA